MKLEDKCALRKASIWRKMFEYPEMEQNCRPILCEVEKSEFSKITENL